MTGTSDKHFATSWEWCSCTDIGYLCVSHQLSVEVASDTVTVIMTQMFLCSHNKFLEAECFIPHCCWVFGTSGTWDRVARLAVPDVSQDRSVFIFKVAYSNKKSSFTLWPFEDEGTKIHCNVSNHEPNNTAPDPRMLSVTAVHVSTGVIAFVRYAGRGHVATQIQILCLDCSLTAIMSHSSASVLLSYFLFDEWDCDLYWWVFAFCSMLPAIIDAVVAIGVLVLRKGWM